MPHGDSEFSGLISAKSSGVGQDMADRIMAMKGTWRPMATVSQACTADDLIASPRKAAAVRWCSVCGRVKVTSHTICSGCETRCEYARGNPRYICPTCGGFKAGIESTICRKCFLARNGKVAKQRLVVPAAGPRDIPPCFDDEETWREYVRGCQAYLHGTGYGTMCADCLPAYKAAMGDRCTHPDVTFRKSGGGVVGMGRGVTEEKEK